MSDSFAIPWTVACQVPLCMGFSRQEYWSGLPFPTPRDLSDPGIKPTSPASLALAGRFFTTEPPGKPRNNGKYAKNISERTCRTGKIVALGKEMVVGG